MRENKRTIIAISIVLLSFFSLDVWLRIQTRWIGKYSIYQPIPTVFTVLWCILLVTLLCVIQKTLIRRIVYGLLYYCFAVYTVIQYGYYLIFGKFLYLNDFKWSGEATDYSGYVAELISVSRMIQIMVLIVIGILGIYFVGYIEFNSKRKYIFFSFVTLICIIGMAILPHMYSDEGEIGFNSPANEYRNFTNSGYDLELAGEYQYIFRDAFLNVQSKTKNYDKEVEAINAFFKEKNVHADNDMTGIFKGKNVIIFMMESMDDWLITEKDTPTIYKMMKDGISFSNLYTPGYASGYTFNTEFAFNLSIYPYSNGDTTYALSKNVFPNSIAAKFKEMGYRVESFHSGTANFYNRGSMHKAFGYEKYNSYREYSDDALGVHVDSFLCSNDELYHALISNEPFLSFVITYSAHLPYSMDDELTRYALEQYPEYAKDLTEENMLRAKARLTDDMFSLLLERLKKDNLLEDTVIVGFADHYAFGMNDHDRLQELSEAAGNAILENTPAFIYNAGSGYSLKVEKTMQITDLAPTIENMFGIDVPEKILGQDVFDQEYDGISIFPEYTWITDKAFVVDGTTRNNNGLDEKEKQSINQYVGRFYFVNDAILDSNYYGR